MLIWNEDFMNNWYDDIYQKALEKINCDKKCRPKYFAIIRPTYYLGQSGSTQGKYHNIYCTNNARNIPCVFNILWYNKNKKHKEHKILFLCLWHQNHHN